MTNGDLISRKALKKEMQKVYPLSTNEMGGVVNKRIYDIIDSAPSIENITVFCEHANKEALESIKKELEKVIERPQGRWVLQYRSCGDAYYTCSICNRAIEVENSQSLKDYPFCHCGANMGGNADE